jgi:hypothetical protein
MKRSKSYSIFRYKCPHCHQGEFFVDRNPYHLSTAGDVLEHCPVCQRRYTPEPGFYYGGLYVAYALAVAACTTIFVATTVLWPSSTMLTRALLVVGGLVVTAPWLYAISKTIWANLFMTYKGVGPTPDELRQTRSRTGSAPTTIG